MTADASTLSITQLHSEKFLYKSFAKAIEIQNISKFPFFVLSVGSSRFLALSPVPSASKSRGGSAQRLTHGSLANGSVCLTKDHPDTWDTSQTRLQTTARLGSGRGGVGGSWRSAGREGRVGYYVQIFSRE